MRKTKPTEFVFYRTQTGAVLRAKVHKRTRNGWVTVEPYFYVDENGKDTGAFQGGHKLTFRTSYLVEV